MRIVVRVRPGAATTVVGGRYGDSDPPVLIVRVRERAVEGRANAAVRDAVAEAFSVSRDDVRILSGQRGRLKHLTVDGADEARLARLLDAAG